MKLKEVVLVGAVALGGFLVVNALNQAHQTPTTTTGDPAAAGGKILTGVTTALKDVWHAVTGIFSNAVNGGNVGA